MIFIGLDAGSVSVKAVVLDETGKKLLGHYKRHKGHPLKAAYELLSHVLREQIQAGGHERDGERISSDSANYSLSITGSYGRLMASALGIGFTNEVIAQSCAARSLFPHIRTIFEMGGEDSKLIILGDKGIRDFSMNSVCAAGTGSFLDQQAERLRLSIEEFGELAFKAKPSRIAGRCSVFAKSDMIHLQQIATPVEDIVAGLCFAVARNFKGSIVKGRTLHEPVSFHGGVAANKGMVRAFKELFGFGQFLVPEDFALMGAIGAALKDRDDGTINTFDLQKLWDLAQASHLSGHGHEPLISEGDDFFERHSAIAEFPLRQAQGGNVMASLSNHEIITAFLGIDIGSISTNLAVVDDDGHLLAKRYLMTAGRPIDAVNQGLREIGEELGGRVEIRGVGTTGSGRYMIADYVGADIVKNEITAQATAAAFIDNKVDTIFEIGGQDSKYVSLRDGVIVDFEMNKACAAGTGSFLEEQAEKLSISIKDEFARCAFLARNPCRLGERCTVFMENSLMANLQKGAERNDLLAGLAYSIVQNYINKVVAGKPIGENIFFQGGVAFNKSVVAAFEKYLRKKVTVPPHHDVTGAIGVALIAMGRIKDRDKLLVTRDEKSDHRSEHDVTDHGSRITTFKGFELSKRAYEISSFECRGCPNVCEINKVKIEGEDRRLFYGGRCEKYDVKQYRGSSPFPDLFAYREELLWKKHNEYSAAFSAQRSALHERGNSELNTQNSKLKIGIPYIFFFHDYLPFWTTLLREMGFDAEVSPKANREIINIGSESVLAETCFPVKVAHGHIKYLIQKGIRDLLIPSFINMNTADEEFERGYACPLTQTIPYAVKASHTEARIIMPVVDLWARGSGSLANEIIRVFKPLGIRKNAAAKAIKAAEKAQEQFSASVKARGAEIISSLRERTAVIVGRPYNAFESGMNLNIPKKLSDLGVLAMPMDFLPASSLCIHDKWPNMYWKSGQRILKAARFIREHPHLYAVFIGNFSCGPDSFILKYFKKEMRDKPFLQIEIDEHSADAGAITRCEAFLDSIGQQHKSRDELSVMSNELKYIKEANCTPYIADHKSRSSDAPHITHYASLKKRTVFIPRMSDHAFAIAAAFERCGVPAEVLPESTKEAVDLGRRYVTGKECYPCAVTTGDMLKKSLSPDFEPGCSAFFMPSGTGPCRFGQYNVFHRMVLDELGFYDVPIFSPNQDVDFYRELGIVGRHFSTLAWKGIIAYELLSKCLLETRPHEKDKGTAQKLYNKYLERLYVSLRGAGETVDFVLQNIRKDFEALPRLNERRPLIGIVGEIFVRSHRFSNEDLILKVEALGGEAWLAPVEEWIYYVNDMAVKKALVNKERSLFINVFLKRFFQKRMEHRLAGHFKDFLKTLKEPVTKDILRKASPYLHVSVEGEAILSIGKSIDMIERGVSGIINAMPFGCMPGTVVTTLMHKLSAAYGIPCISIPYDGTESPATEIQLEAFMNQAHEYNR